jgi:hypothetical protein
MAGHNLDFEAATRYDSKSNSFYDEVTMQFILNFPIAKCVGTAS